MKGLVIICISLFFAAAFFGNCSNVRKTSNEEISYFEERILEVYGEEIYIRESCKNCHTQ